MDMSKYESNINFTPEQFEKIAEIAIMTNQNILQVAKDIERSCMKGKIIQEVFDELTRGAE